MEESKRQVINKFDTCQKELTKTTSEVKKIKKQIGSKENQFLTQIKKMQRDYCHLQDKSRGQCGEYKFLYPSFIMNFLWIVN